MVKTGLVAVALASTLATSVFAEELVVVTDDSGAVLGPVVGGTFQNSAFEWFLFAHRLGDTIIFLHSTPMGDRVETPGPSSHYLYFSSPDCGGIPAFARLEDAAPVAVAPPRLYTPILLGVESGDVWGVDAFTVTPPISVGSKRHAQGYPYPAMACEQITPAALTGYPVDYLGTLSFTFPLHMGINPVIFQDQFQTGDMSRWSNY